MNPERLQEIRDEITETHRQHAHWLSLHRPSDAKLSSGPRIGVAVALELLAEVERLRVLVDRAEPVLAACELELIAHNAMERGLDIPSVLHAALMNAEVHRLEAVRVWREGGS